MPGIAGLLTQRPRAWAEPQLHAVLDSIRHESFYGTGTFIDESLGVYLGWTFRQDSAEDRTLQRSEDGTVALVFSGENSAGPENPARQNGCSALLHRYKKDPAFPASIDGVFHGMVIDSGQATATLFNDRFGMHALYYHEAREAFYFAAEAKAILKVRPELRTLDPRSLGEWIASGCVLENRTLFPEIYALPGAAQWSFRQGAIASRKVYFQPREWEEQPRLDPESYYREVRDVCSQSFGRYFAGEPRIGISLTGGLDSRIIMAWQRAAPGALRCYTFGGMYRDCRDVTVARRVARACRQPHDVITAGSEFLGGFSRYAERTVYLTDGGADVSRAPVLYVNQLARALAPVRVAGVYGSEILRRVRTFKAQEPAPGLFCPELLQHVRAGIECHRELSRVHPLTQAVFQRTPQRAVDALERSQLDVRTPYLSNALVQTAFRSPDAAVVRNDASADNKLCLRLIADGRPALRRIRTDLGLAGSSGTITSGAARRFQNLTFKAEYAWDYGMPHWLARIDHVFRPLHSERLFLGRHKFYHFRIWYRDALARYVRETLLDPRSLERPWLAPGGLEAIVRGHLEGDRNQTTAIHKALTLELLHRVLLDSK